MRQCIDCSTVGTAEDFGRRRRCKPCANKRTVFLRQQARGFTDNRGKWKRTLSHLKKRDMSRYQPFAKFSPAPPEVDQLVSRFLLLPRVTA
jgi:hypothetical protein